MTKIKMAVALATTATTIVSGIAYLGFQGTDQLKTKTNSINAYVSQSQKVMESAENLINKKNKELKNESSILEDKQLELSNKEKKLDDIKNENDKKNMIKKLQPYASANFSNALLSTTYEYGSQLIDTQQSLEQKILQYNQEKKAGNAAIANQLLPQINSLKEQLMEEENNAPQDY